MFLATATSRAMLSRTFYPSRSRLRPTQKTFNCDAPLVQEFLELRTCLRTLMQRQMEPRRITAVTGMKRSKKQISPIQLVEEYREKPAFFVSFRSNAVEFVCS